MSAERWLERTTCDECGQAATLVDPEPCPNCGASGRRAPTDEERAAALEALVNATSSVERHLTRAYIPRKKARTDAANEKRKAKHEERVRRAHELRDQGLTVVKVAAALGTSERRAYALLAETRVPAPRES